SRPPGPIYSLPGEGERPRQVHYSVLHQRSSGQRKRLCVEGDSRCKGARVSPCRLCADRRLKDRRVSREVRYRSWFYCRSVSTDGLDACRAALPILDFRFWIEDRARDLLKIRLGNPKFKIGREGGPDTNLNRSPRELRHANRCYRLAASPE